MERLKKRKKLIVVLLTLLFCIGIISPLVMTAVRAASTEELYVIDLPRANETNKTGWGHPAVELMNGWGMESSSKGNMKALGSYEGQAAYCIEPGIGSWTFDELTQKDETYWDSYPGKFNQTISPELIKLFIGRVMHYGYVGNVSPSWTSTNSGADRIAEIKATQLIIWEIIVGERDENFNKVDGADYGKDNVLDLIPSNYPLRSETLEHYNRIVNAVKNHVKLPSGFSRSASSAKTYKPVYNGSAYTVTIPDTNKMLSEYSFSADISGVTFSVSGNNLVIKVKDPSGQNIKVTAERKNSKRRGVVVWTDGTTGQENVSQRQNVATYGQTVNDPIEGYLNLEIDDGSVKIQKTSEDGKVSGISFRIQGNKTDQTVTTGSGGEIQVNDLAPGRYTVTEISSKEYEPQESKQVTVIGGQTASVSFHNTLKKGSLKVTKTSEDGMTEGVKFRLSGTSLSGQKVDEYAVTDSSGIAVFEDIPVSGGTPYVLEEAETEDRYVLPEKQNVLVEWNKVTQKSFKNVLKKWSLTVTKTDQETGSPQGDASLSGAKYGIYQGEKLIGTYTTDSSGKFTTKSYVCGDDWTLREIQSSEGYLIDPTVHHIGAEPKEYTVEYNEISMDVTEQVIKGKIAIIKHSDDGQTGIETPEPGAEFQVYLKSAGSFDSAKETERDTLVCDENGFARTKLFPAGTYTVHQTKGLEGTEKIPDFDVLIDEHEKTYFYLLNNAAFESMIEIVKKDAETGKVIPAAGVGVKIKNLSTGEFITQHINYPTPADLDTFYTDSTGKLMLPQSLHSGKFELHEVQSCDGYVLNKEPIPFTVDETEAVVTVELFNTPQKGSITITKTGEVISSVTESDGIYQPVYAEANLSGAVYEIYAAEDIVTLDGTVRAVKDDLVSTIETNSSGKAASGLLYLGKYKIVEKEAPYGMTLNPEPQLVELTYAGQEVEITQTAVSFQNERQKIEISLKKQLEQEKQFGIGMNGELLSVQFGLYAEEDMKAADGKVIPKDSLLEIVSCSQDGSAVFMTDLPVESSVYVKEYSADEHYLLSSRKYPVSFDYAGQDTTKTEVVINNGEAIENELIRGTIEGKKTDEDGFPIAGAVFGLFEPNETEFTEKNALMTAKSNPIGVFLFEDVPYGEWTVRELKPASAFVLNTANYPVTVSQDKEIIRIEVENRFLTGSVRVVKADEEYPTEKLSGAVFEVYADADQNRQFDETADKSAGELTEIQPGIYQLDGLRYGGYFLCEKLAPEFFLLDYGYYYFEIKEDKQTVTVSNRDSTQFSNRARTGSLKIVKTAEDGKVEGRTFQITGTDFTGRAYDQTFATDENGEICVTLRPGEYTVSEQAGKDTAKYILPDDQTVTVVPDKEITVRMHNRLIPETELPKTGDGIQTVLFVSGIAALTAGVSILLCIHKRKKNNQSIGDGRN